MRQSARLCFRVSCARRTQKRVVIPPLNPPAASSASLRSSSRHPSEYQAYSRPHPDIASFLDDDGAASLRRQQQVDSFNTSADALMEKVWRDSKPHLRRQEELVKTLGVDGAVAETLRPTKTSFHEELRQRPLDRAILEEIYHGLHGRRIERKLKKGVSWEHWITKGDGTAPVYNTSQKAQQTFAFGGRIEEVRCATHPQQFPVLIRPGAQATTAPSRASGGRGGGREARHHRRHRGSSPAFVDRLDLIPEVAFIGRTSSGKSSLVNAILNSTVTPYGHLQGTTSSVRFYSIAHKLVMVDCPGYGHYNPLQTPELDAENAVKCMRAYLRCGARAPLKPSSHSPKDSAGSSATADADVDADETDATSTTSTASEEGGMPFEAASQVDRLGYQRRLLKRVFLCVPAHGMQHLDYAYCQLLESYQIPFTVVLTKTDAAPIRFLARLADHTRCQLVQYKHCKELMLTSSLRLAGIDKMQTLIGSMALDKDRYDGATMDFSSIV